MKNITAFFLFGLLAFTFACSDPELDPFQLDKLTKGSILALRGSAFDSLNDISYLGSIAKFSVSGDPASEKFEFDGAFLSDDVGSLSKVEVYARATAAGARKLVATVDGGAFSVPTGEKYPQASFSIPFPTILSALGIAPGDKQPGEYLFIECDLTLRDGTVIPASSIVNSSLFESDLFFPAHNLLYLAVD